jgi:hypothetical protein
MAAGESAGEGAVAVRAERGSTLGLAAPAQLPAAARHFTGRVIELDTLSESLADLDGGAGALWAVGNMWFA